MGLNDITGQQGRRICVIREDKLYDLTQFAERHPGGWQVLDEHNGQNVDNVMQDTTSHVHSKAAYAILENYYVAPVKQNGTYQSLAEPSTRHEDYYKNDIVDWSKPLAGQVGQLGEKYFDWTHQTVDRPIRLFESNIAELFTKAYWWFVPVVWGPVILYNLYTSFQSLSLVAEMWPPNVLGCHWGAKTVPVLFAVGLILWTLLEYVIHRWIFHLRPPANWPFLIKLHFALHGQHHKCPMDPYRLVFAPVPASVFALLIFWGCEMLFPQAMAKSVFAGIVMGYIVYDCTHYYIHHGSKPFLKYFQCLKTHHTQHHYEHHQLGFGITSKVWDYPFGTLIPDEDSGEKCK